MNKAFFNLIFLSTLLLPLSRAWALPDGKYLYVVTDGNTYAYRFGGKWPLVQTIPLPSTVDGTRGAVACSNGMLYVSHGSDRGPGGKLLGYNLLTGSIAFDMTYGHGVDSFSIAEDCQRIYMPDGEITRDGNWYVEDAETGEDRGVVAGPLGPHNTVVNAADTRVYLGGRFSNPGLFQAFNTKDNKVYLTLQTSKPFIRPFAVTRDEHYAFVCVNHLNGYLVLDLTQKKELYTVTQAGDCVDPYNCPSHGVDVNPNNQKEIAILDWCHNQVHFWDVSGLPGKAPREKAKVTFSHPMRDKEPHCAYDCAREGWVQYSLDGKYLFVGDAGAVMDVAARREVAFLAHLYDTRKCTEVDWAGGAIVGTQRNRNSN